MNPRKMNPHKLMPYDESSDEAQLTDPGCSEPFRRPRIHLETNLELAVVWCRHEPDRVGETLQVRNSADQPQIFGRDGGGTDAMRAELVAVRPWSVEARGAPNNPKLSRQQLEISIARLNGISSRTGAIKTPSGTPSDRALHIRNIGRCRLLHNGREVLEAFVQHGDLLELKNQMLLLCLERRGISPWPEGLTYPAFPFGDADPFGIVGESPAVWEHRKNIAVYATFDQHTLVLGATGSGKEATARALHALSLRRAQPFLYCDIKAIPENFIATELFGNRKGYPTGAEARDGLVTRSHRGVLCLDEIGDMLKAASQDLRGFLETGQYHVLGGKEDSRADVRVIGTTNRPLEEFEAPDVQLRFRATFEVPSLSDRIEDIPLIARHILRRMAQENPQIAAYFFEGGSPGGSPRMAPDLVVRLLQAASEPGNVRSLQRLLSQVVVENLKHPETGWLVPPDQDEDEPWLRSPSSANGMPSRGAPAREVKAAAQPPAPAIPHAPRTETEAFQRFEAVTEGPDSLRLQQFRRHLFNVDLFCSEAGLGSSVANDCLNVLLFKALVCAEGCSTTASRLVAGEVRHEVPTLKRRLDAALRRLSRELEDTHRGDAAFSDFIDKIRRRYRASSSWVEKVIRLIQAGSVT